jgi:hypothetical protein
MAIVLLEGLGKMKGKNPLASSGFQPLTFWAVV